MTLHFMHIGKTGGTSIKHALRQAKLAYWREENAHKFPETPYGRIQLHHHRFRMRDIPSEDHVFFCVRDPIERFLSAFYSRMNKGQPRYNVGWSNVERRAFEAFPTPQRLAGALASEDVEERSLAELALRSVRHMRPMRWSVTPRQLRSRPGQVIYIGRQETLATDWEQLKALLQLPPDLKLPTDRVTAHRRDGSLETALDAAAVAALRKWYRDDYLLLTYCDALRAWNHWGAGPQPAGAQRLRYELARTRGLPAVLPVPPTWIRRRLIGG